MKLLREESGSALLEFAAILSVMVLLLLGLAIGYVVTRPSVKQS